MFIEMVHKNIRNMFVGLVLIVGSSIVTGLFIIDNIEKKQEAYYEKVTQQNYTVYCDGEKLEFPEKIDLDSFVISEIDDSDQEIILTKK